MPTMIPIIAQFHPILFDLTHHIHPQNRPDVPRLICSALYMDPAILMLVFCPTIAAVFCRDHIPTPIPGSQQLCSYRWCGTNVLVLPDSGSHITGSSGEHTTRSWGWRNRDDRVLVTLEHKLGISCSWVPKLNTTVLGAGKNPCSIWGESNTEDEVLDNRLVQVSKIEWRQENIPCVPRKS